MLIVELYGIAGVLKILLDVTFLAPPAEWQRSFSNAVRRPSSVVIVVVRRQLSLKWLISQKWPDNFFSFLAWSFIRKVLMYKNMDLV